MDDRPIRLAPMATIPTSTSLSPSASFVPVMGLSPCIQITTRRSPHAPSHPQCAASGTGRESAARATNQQRARQSMRYEPERQLAGVAIYQRFWNGSVNPPTRSPHERSSGSTGSSAAADIALANTASTSPTYA